MFHGTAVKPTSVGVFLVLALVGGCGDRSEVEVLGRVEADDLDQLIREAESEGPAIWYDSSPEDQGKAVAAAFARRNPGAEIRHVRLVGGLDIAARMVLEAQAPGQAADVATLAAEQAQGLHERSLLSEVPWSRFGVPPEMEAAPFALATATAVFVLLYNSDRVGPAAPESWADLLAPMWAGRIGTWVSPHALVQLVPAWGGERTARYVTRFAAQAPVLFRSTFPLAQAVASGELAAGVGIWHSAKPLMEAGAPIEATLLSPTPVSTLYTVVARGSTNPGTARLFAAWLSTREGALAYEAATGRGNRLVPETETARMLEGRETSEFPFAEVGETADWMARFGAQIRAGAPGS